MAGTAHRPPDPPGPPERPLNLREYEAVARDRIDPVHFDYIAGGARDEVTLRANEAAFGRCGCCPRAARQRQARVGRGPARHPRRTARRALPDRLPQARPPRGRARHRAAAAAAPS
ncbi:alpha-hydroxy-acid oxidizing protein [Streptomyces sp. M19]